jgi:hypothetical protein
MRKLTMWWLGLGGQNWRTPWKDPCGCSGDSLHPWHDAYPVPPSWLVHGAPFYAPRHQIRSPLFTFDIGINMLKPSFSLQQLLQP